MLRRSWGAIGCLAFVFLLTGARPALPAGAITLLAGFGVGYTPFYVADQAGMFKATGLDILTKYSVLGKAAVDGEVAGAGVAALAGQLPSVTAGAAGAPVVVVAPIASYTGDTKLIASKDIRTAVDLKGKRVGFPFGTEAHMYLTRYLKQHGLALGDVTPVNVSPEGLAPALARGDLQAVVIWEPHASNALQAASGSHVLAAGGVMKSYELLTMRRDFVRGHPAEAEQILHALERAVDFTQKNPSIAAQYTAAVGHISTDQVRRLMPTYSFDMTMDNEFMAEMQNTVQFLTDQKMLQSAVPAKDFIDLSVLRHVDNGLVHVP